MPLKEPDLKDTESYKKASRQDLSKISAGNAKFWVYKDVELPDPTGKKRKYPAFLALIDEGGIRKSMTGRKLICKGLCGMKEGKIAFDAKVGKVPYRLLKVSVPLLLGKMVWIPTGQEEDEGGEVEDGAAPASSGQPAPSQTPAISGPQVMARWKALLPQMQAAAAAQPDRKADFQRVAASIKEAFDAGKFDIADQLLNNIDALLKLDPRENEYRARYQKLAPLVAAALKDPARDSSRVRAIHAFVLEKAEAHDFATALKALPKLEEALAASPAAPQGRGIDYKISLLNWEKAQKQVRAELSKLEAAIVKEFATEPKLPAIKTALRKLDRVLGGFDSRLADKIKEAISASAADLPALHKQALAIVDEYLDYVDTDSFMDALDSNPFTPVSVREPLDKTLRELAGQFSS